MSGAVHRDRIEQQSLFLPAVRWVANGADGRSARKPGDTGWRILASHQVRPFNLSGRGALTVTRMVSVERVTAKAVWREDRRLDTEQEGRSPVCLIRRAGLGRRGAAFPG